MLLKIGYITNVQFIKNLLRSDNYGRQQNE